MEYDGFKLGKNATRCTKGLCLWTSLLDQPVGHGVLLLDCEGLAESVSLGKERVNLFSLYVLLYSTLIHHQLFSGHIRTKSSSDLSFLQRFGLAVRASESTLDHQLFPVR
ncbi:hypothetical protein L2E82_02902 [Cichorium intybus]|uniref:Uncharacterized protein n=1 Tax=Cichorium intybus TaxID=13427 RepID=A0ACB9H2K8_CICIN|nr:hypothetical protein L2E82_02902 [Cichorium intybus]